MSVVLMGIPAPAAGCAVMGAEGDPVVLRTHRNPADCFLAPAGSTALQRETSGDASLTSILRMRTDATNP